MQIMTRRCTLLAVGIASLLMHAPGCRQPPAVPIERAIRVTRWDYKTQEDVEQCIKNVADGGFETVILTVRGNETVI